MAYDDGVLTSLRNRWENPESYDEHITEYAEREHGLSQRQVYNRIRSLAPDQNTESINAITGRGHNLIDTVNKTGLPNDTEHALAQTLQSINLEPKQALLLTATDQQTSSQHFKTLDRVVNDAHLPDRSTFRNYTSILHDTGMLDKYELGSTVGVKRTEYQRSNAGHRVGGPAAAGALDHAVTHGRSLYDIIGQVAKAGDTNGLYTRTRILETIQSSPEETSVADIVNAVDTARGTIDRHVLQLRDNDVIHHPSAASKAKRYRLTDDTGVDQDVREPFEDHQYVTAEILADHAGISTSYAKERLKTLHEQGNLSSPSGQKRSKLTLTPHGNAFTRYVNELRGLINGDDRSNHLKHSYNVLLADKEHRDNHIRRAFELHAQSSNNVNQREREKRLKQIVRTVEEHDDGYACTRDIANATNLSRQMTHAYLNELKQDFVKTVVDKNGEQQRYKRTDKELDTI